MIGAERGPRRGVDYSRKGVRGLLKVHDQELYEEVEVQLVDSLTRAVEVWRERRVLVRSFYGRPGVWMAVSGVLVRVERVDGRVRHF